MTVLDLSGGFTGEITAILGGGAMAERLRAFGLFPGSRIRVVRAAPFRGPLLIEELSSGARVMIGRGMASKIEVSVGASTRS